MANTPPRFWTPPVVETALGVQFEPLSGFSTAHAGWFWREYLQKSSGDPSLKWSQATDAPRLEDQLERFDALDKVVPPVSMRLLLPSTTNRAQIIRSDNERMVQVQNTRFILNWKKIEGAYPKFGPLVEEFRSRLGSFESFAAEVGFGAIKYNQWEIAYVDAIKRCEILPGIVTRPRLPETLVSSGGEVISGDWRFSLAEQKGRMYISLRLGRTAPKNEEALIVTFVARGPVSDSMTWENGFEIGHDAIFQTFLAITSDQARQHWERRHS